VASNYFSGDAWRYNQDGSQKDEPVAPQALVTSKVYFDVAIDKKPAGRVIIGLHGHVVARTVDNFERICRGDEQIGNVKLTYEGSTMHRIIPGFMIQGGERPGRSVYKSIHFDDENFQLKHTGPGVLSMANAGKDTNTSQFFITTVRTPHLDGKHTVFGTVLDGWNVVRAMEACGTSSGKPMRDVVVTKCGVLEEEPENK
jgi:cyclophilin family peptidyl-prolyl cis-trans isomerase